MGATDGPSIRADFEALVRRSTRPLAGEGVLLARLGDQLAYQEHPSRDGLEDLAAALATALTRGPAAAEPALRRLAAEHASQPLCQYHLLAARLELGDRDGVADALDRLEHADRADPMVELLRRGLAGEPPPAVSEDTRLANIARLAGTPLLRNPYRLVVGAIFEAIRDVEHARVLDVGVGSGAQMSGLLDLLAAGEHRVRRLDIVGLDFVEEFLEAGGRAIAAGADRLGGGTRVVYQPVRGRIEALDDDTVDRIRRGGPLDAANATIALHEVPGEGKLAALGNLRRLEPGRLTLAEWDFLLENTLPAEGMEFLFHIRSVVAAMVGALRERHPLAVARAVARDWMSLGAGQLTCPASRRQECFLDAPVWRALLERCGFEVIPPAPALLRHASSPDHAGIAAEGWYLETSRHASPGPIALIQARPR